MFSLYLFLHCSGSRTGYIHHHDVRVPEHLVGSFAGHSQEVCGLKWSPDGMYLASGGNDNLLNIWQARAGLHYTNSEALHTFGQHVAAVKVIIIIDNYLPECDLLHWINIPSF